MKQTHEKKLLDSHGNWLTMTERVKNWKERRIARFKTSGCALCWHHCSHDKPVAPL